MLNLLFFEDSSPVVHELASFTESPQSAWISSTIVHHHELSPLLFSLDESPNTVKDWSLISVPVWPASAVNYVAARSLTFGD